MHKREKSGVEIGLQMSSDNSAQLFPEKENPTDPGSSVPGNSGTDPITGVSAFVGGTVCWSSGAQKGDLWRPSPLETPDAGQRRMGASAGVAHDV